MTNTRRAFVTLALITACTACTGEGSQSASTATRCEHDDTSTEDDGNHGKAEVIEFADAKLIIEHNAADEDTGFQGFVDGEPWQRLDILGPDGAIARIDAEGALQDFGLTELFFETNEPPNADVPIAEVLALLPEGTYDFVGLSAEGDKLVGSAALSHLIPAAPEITMPASGVVVRHDSDLVVAWTPVTEAIFGGKSASITHYQLIVEKADQEPGPGFGSETLRMHLPATVTQMRVPSEFLQPGTAYDLEVLAIDASGNQTIATGAFETAPLVETDKSVADRAAIREENAL